MVSYENQNTKNNFQWQQKEPSTLKSIVYFLIPSPEIMHALWVSHSVDHFSDHLNYKLAKDLILNVGNLNEKH